MSTIKTVHTILSEMFDCILIPLPANSEDLRWLLPILLGPGCGQESVRDNDEVRLEEVGHSQLTPKRYALTIKFKMKNPIDLWKRFVWNK